MTVPEHLLCPSCGRLLNRVTRMCVCGAGPAATTPPAPAKPAPAPAPTPAVAAPPPAPTAARPAPVAPVRPAPTIPARSGGENRRPSAQEPAPTIPARSGGENRRPSAQELETVSRAVAPPKVAKGVVRRVRWRRRRFDVVVFEGEAVLVQRDKKRPPEALAAMSAGQLLALGARNRVLRDPDVDDVAVREDPVGGRGVVRLRTGERVVLSWWGFHNRGVAVETLLGDAFPGKVDLADPDVARRAAKAVLAVVLVVAGVVGVRVGVGALLSLGGDDKPAAAPVTTLPPAEQAARAELAQACPPWDAFTAALARGARPDPAALRPVVDGMRPRFDAAAAAAPAYATARDQLAVLQDYARKDPESAAKESSARISFARDAVDRACAVAG